ncbi:hypothetical protein PO124_24830 [Bacillus licheniformis]|nr:hypothetical protein [Bacillus licheniformis]
MNRKMLRPKAAKGYMYPAAVLLFLSLAIGLGTELIAPYFTRRLIRSSTPKIY